MVISKILWTGVNFTSHHTLTCVVPLMMSSGGQGRRRTNRNRYLFQNVNWVVPSSFRTGSLQRPGQCTGGPQRSAGCFWEAAVLPVALQVSEKTFLRSGGEFCPRWLRLLQELRPADGRVVQREGHLWPPQGHVLRLLSWPAKIWGRSVFVWVAPPSVFGNRVLYSPQIRVLNKKCISWGYFANGSATQNVPTLFTSGRFLIFLWFINSIDSLEEFFFWHIQRKLIFKCSAIPRHDFPDQYHIISIHSLLEILN